MRSFRALVKKDLKAYFDQPTGFILLIIFVGFASFFYFRTILLTPEASMRPLFSPASFTSLPWMLAVFVPASTMRLVAEEQRDGTLEILLTQPIMGWTVLMAKFTAGLLFVATGIVATVVIPLALQTAGDFDDGAIIAQYIGTFFLTASFVAVGLFTSSLTQNQIVAFIMGFIIIMVLRIAGSGRVTLAIPPVAAVLVQDLSPSTHFTGIARGVLDLRDVLYFVALISTFLSATYLMIRGKSVSHRSPLYRNLQLGVGGLVVVSVLIGWSGSFIGGRLDLTENQLFTLSDASVEILRELDDIVTVKLFTSKEPPVQIALTTRDVNDLLNDIADASEGRVKVVRKYADEDDATSEEAKRSFVPPVQFTEQSGGEFKVKLGYLGMGMTYANRQEVIPFVDSTAGLEYRLLANIRRMSQKKPSTISFLFGEGEFRRDADLQSFRDQLERQHDVLEIDAEREETFVEGTIEPFRMTDVLIVPGPTKTMLPGVLASIDEYLAQGGKVMFLVDSLVIDDRVLRGTLNQTGMTEYLAGYGVNLLPDVVFDTRSHETLSFTTRFGAVSLPYPYWVRAPTLENKISGGVSGVVFPWAGSIEIGEVVGETVEGEITPLLATTEFAALDGNFRDLTPTSPVLEEFTEDELGTRLLAVAVTGTRCPYLKPKCEKDPSKTFRMIVASDSQWLTEQMVSGYPEAIALAVNWVDWLSQEDQLAAIRAKGTTSRPLVFTSDLHRELVQQGSTIGLPALFAVLGLIRWFLRRRATRKVYAREG